MFSYMVSELIFLNKTQSAIMASSSTITNTLLGHVVTEKLSKNNHLLWKAQVLPVVIGA
jgi:hypothetical protein